MSPSAPYQNPACADAATRATETSGDTANHQDGRRKVGRSDTRTAAASPADTVSDLDFSAAVMAAEAGAAVDGDDPPLVPAEPVVDSLGGGGLRKEGGELCKGGGAGGGGNAGTGGGLGFGGGGGGGEGGGDEAEVVVAAS